MWKASDYREDAYNSVTFDGNGDSSTTMDPSFSRRMIIFLGTTQIENSPMHWGLTSSLVDLRWSSTDACEKHQSSFSTAAGPIEKATSSSFPCGRAGSNRRSSFACFTLNVLQCICLSNNFLSPLPAIPGNTNRYSLWTPQHDTVIFLCILHHIEYPHHCSLFWWSRLPKAAEKNVKAILLIIGKHTTVWCQWAIIKTHLESTQLKIIGHISGLTFPLSRPVMQ